MKIQLPLLLLALACSQITPKKTPPEEDLVSLEAALNQSQASYLLGCVEAFRTLKLGPSFDHCREKAKAHRLEVESILQAPIEGDSREKL